MNPLMMMLIQLGIVLLFRWLAKQQLVPETTAIEQAVIDTKSPQDALNLLVGPVLGSAIDYANLPPETAETINAIVNVKNQDDIDALVENPKVKLGLFEAIGNLLFGKK